MISYFEYRQMERWTQRVRRETRRDMYRLRRQRQREEQSAVAGEMPMITLLSWLHIAHAWWRSIVLPQIDRAVAQLVPSRRADERLLPDAAVRQQ
jgi:hypothetical protein